MIIWTILKKIGWFLQRAFWFYFDNWKVTVPATLILIVGVWFMRACNKPPKLDEKEIQRAQQAIAEKDRAAMKEILVQSEVREKQIDANLANAENEKLKAFDEARKKAEGMTNEELAKALEERSH